MNAEEIRQINLTSNGEKVPFLNETLDFCSKNNIKVIK